MRSFFSFSKILILIFIYTLAYNGEVKSKEKYRDDIIQLSNEEFIETNIEGKLRKYKITYLTAFPNLKKKLNQKNWECRKWSITEVNADEQYIAKQYSLNDCLPCLDKGSGYLCSFPYVAITLKTSLYDKLLGSEDKIMLEIYEDGTNEIDLWVNLGARERIHINRKKVMAKNEKIYGLYASKIIKYNTNYRDIPSETSKFKYANGQKAIVLMRVLDRIVRKTNEAIQNKNELIIREKDLKTLMSIEPSATIFKFQTRD